MPTRKLRTHPAGRPAPPRATAREWVGLAVLALPTLLVSVDIGALYLALPSLTTDLGASAKEQLWITDVYGFLLAGFLITMGNLGDRVGRRRLLLVGASLFALTSTAAAFSTSAEMLIVARALMGVAAATLMPSTLALISTVFQDPGQRTRAISVWVSTMMFGAAAGPVVGGLLLTAFWWGAVFLIAVPVAAALLLAGPRYLPEVRADAAPSVDWTSATLSVAGLLPVIFGLKTIALGGRPAYGLAALAVGGLLLAGFVRRQMHLTNPLLDLRLFARPVLSTTVAGMLLMAAAMAGTFLVVSQYVQSVLGLSPAAAGLWLLPMGLSVAAGAQVAPTLSDRLGPRAAISGGLVLAVGGFVLVAVPGVLVTGGGASLFFIEVGGILLHLGAGPLFALGAGIIVTSVPPERAGAAASLSEISNNLGATLGLAVLGTTASAVYTRSLDGSAEVATAGLPSNAMETVAATVEAARGLPASVRAAVAEAAREAFSTGLAVVATASAVTMLVVAVLVSRHDGPRQE